MSVAGFALVEFAVDARGRVRGGRRIFEALGRAVEQAVRSKNQATAKRRWGRLAAGIGATAVRWPRSARIVGDRPIRWQYGLPNFTKFNLYISVTARNRGDLITAFDYLDSHCHVEGYM